MFSLQFQDFIFGWQQKAWMNFRLGRFGWVHVLMQLIDEYGYYAFHI